MAHIVVARTLTVRQTERMLRIRSQDSCSTDTTTQTTLMVAEGWRQRVRFRWSRTGNATVALHDLSKEELQRLLGF